MKIGAGSPIHFLCVALVPSAECGCELRVHRCQWEHYQDARIPMGVHGLVRLYGHLWRWNAGTYVCKNKFRKPNSVHIVFHSNLKLYLMWNYFCVALFLQVSQPKCMEKEAGLVEETYCASLVKPEEKSRSCNKQSCPPRYVILHFVVQICQDPSTKWLTCHAMTNTFSTLRHAMISFALLAYVWSIANLIVTLDKIKKIFSLVEWNFFVKQFRWCLWPLSDGGWALGNTVPSLAAKAVDFEDERSFVSVLFLMTNKWPFTTPIVQSLIGRPRKMYVSL